ncbi:MAG: type VI secretion system baseplate subunit TssK [Nitrospinae bacterium]|nr:type VI secretion system baseplate subunit TssK [Nitrospinota bacterium]
MHNAHDIPESIQWHEGMLLSPQHFQQLVLRQERLLHYQIGANNPFCWGVRHLKIDQSLLVNGAFRVLELEAILPDGLVISHNTMGSGDLTLDLKEYADEMQQAPVTVHLVVPALKAGEAVFKGDLARYDSLEGNVVADENTGESELRVPRLKPRLSLLVAEHPPHKFAALPLAKVGYSNESFSLTDFIPPALSVSPQSPLGSMCSMIAKRLREKAVFLSYEVLAPSSTSGMPMVLETKTLIQAMVSSLPLFEGILSTGVSHPYHLYLGLCSLVGNLAALGPLIPPVLPPYNHNDPRTAFEQAQKYIFRMLDEGIQEAYTAIPFYFEEEMFGARFDAAWMNKPTYVGVRGQVGMSEKEVIDWVDKCWIGSNSRIQSMRDKRILGPERKRVERVEELVPARGVILFSLKIDSKYVVPDEPLQIYNTTSVGPRPSEVVLYIKKKTESSF